MLKPLRERYTEWLAKYNAPDSHPHRELYDMLVGESERLDQRLNAMRDYMAEQNDIDKSGLLLAERLDQRLHAVERWQAENGNDSKEGADAIRELK